MLKKPELLAPAGTLEALKTAFHYGADAVYGGMKSFGLRAFAGNFDDSALQEAVRIAHAHGGRFYVTMNIYPFDDQIDAFTDAAKRAADIGVDAAIVSDIGAISVLRERVPGLPVHVSTQANTVNSAAVKHYAAMGCERVILAREMSLDRIAAMRRTVPEETELEMFVHGAACMSYSGRCLLSQYLTGRNANQGACAQSCRWTYRVVEEKRPGEYMPVDEDEHGTYIFSAKDLCLMPLLPRILDAGISSLKIEGRMKTEYYVGIVTGAYRRAIDLLVSQGVDAFYAELPVFMEELQTASHRESDTGFALESPNPAGGIEGCHQTREYIGRVIDMIDSTHARVLQKNRLFAGDSLELVTPKGISVFEAKPFVREKTGETVSTLSCGGETLIIEVPEQASAGDLIRGQVRNHRI